MPSFSSSESVQRMEVPERVLVAGSNKSTNLYNPYGKPLHHLSRHVPYFGLLTIFRFHRYPDFETQSGRAARVTSAGTGGLPRY